MTTSAARTTPPHPTSREAPDDGHVRNAPGALRPRVVDGVSEAVGGTPLVRLRHLFPDSDLEVFAKLESVNPGGSTKDRPALAMVREALASGRLRAGGTVVESSSGNLAVALARVCTAHGLRFVAVVDPRTNATTVRTVRALGGEVDLVAEPDPETGDLLTARLHRVQALLGTIPGAVNLSQYDNPANPGAHRDGTMREIAEALGHRLDVLMAATSTVGTLAGCSAYLHEYGMDTRVLAVDAEGSVLFGGTAAPRPLPGLGAGVVTAHSRTVRPDQVLRVSGRDCVVGARLLARREGILAGASTGGIIQALGREARILPAGSRVVLVVHDGGVPYLETVYDDDWVAETLGVDAAGLEAASAQLEEAARRG